MIDDRVKSLSEINQNTFYGYLQWLTNKSEAAQSITQRRSNAIMLLEEIAQDVTELTSDSLVGYVTTKRKSSNINNTINNTKTFLIYLNEQGLNQIDPNCLNGYMVPIKTAREEADKATSLSLFQADEIKDKITGQPRLQFAFYATYWYGFTLDELAEFSLAQYDAVSKTVHLSERSIVVNEYMHGLLSAPSHQEFFKETVSKVTYQDRITQTGDLIGINLSWLDLMKTRKVHFFRCWLCNELFEPYVMNFDVVEPESSNRNKYVVCKRCAEKGERV